MSAQPAGGGTNAPQPSSQAGVTRGGQVLTVEQVVALCFNMTGDRGRVTTAAAIILAESGGKTDARCYNRKRAGTGVVYCGAPGPGPGGTGGGVISIDRGLCQFNSVSHAELSDAECDDPRHAVAAMFHVSHGFVDFHEWATYNSGAYRRFIGPVSGVADQVTAQGPGALTRILATIGGGFVAGGNAAGAVAGGVVAATVSVGQFLAKLSDPRTWKRVLLVLVGIVAVIVGAFMLDRDLLSQVAGSAVTNAAGAAAAAAV